MSLIRSVRPNRLGVVVLLGIVVLLGVVILAPILLSGVADRVDVFQANQGPTSRHLLGTDSLGRDLLARLVVATRLSVGLALIATAISATVGVSLGAGAALLPKVARTAALRFIDTMLAFPVLLIALFVSVIAHPGATGATLGVGVAGSFYIARVTSASALSVIGQEYVLAARVLGVPRRALFSRYVLPNVGDTLLVVVSAAIANAIVFLSALSFLGVGVQSPSYDWGSMLTNGVQQFYLTPVAALTPAVAISITALMFGFAGEAVARLLNPLRVTGSGRSTARGSSITQSGGARGSGGTAIPDSAILVVEGLSVQYPSAEGSVDIVSDVSFHVAKGELIGIVGESGSGKTTVANAIAQLTSESAIVSGRVALRGIDLAALGRAELDRVAGADLAVVFQDPMAALNPSLRVGTQLTEGVRVHRRVRRKEARKLAIARLAEAHVPAPTHMMRRYPRELSGGMRQRVIMAMGLMNQPQVLIADEPTTSLDVTIQAQIMDVLYEINREHHTAVILISHNLGLVGQNCDRVLVMYAGRIVEEIPTAALDIPQHPYTRALLDVVPDMSSSTQGPLPVIPGQAPEVGNRPPGCAFHPRCPLVVDRCRTDLPPLMAQPSGGRVACWVTGTEETAVA